MNEFLRIPRRKGKTCLFRSCPVRVPRVAGIGGPGQTGGEGVYGGIWEIGVDVESG